jgi:hypothetical protein
MIAAALVLLPTRLALARADLDLTPAGCTRRGSDRVEPEPASMTAGPVLPPGLADWSVTGSPAPRQGRRSSGWRRR